MASANAEGSQHRLPRQRCAADGVRTRPKEDAQRERSRVRSMASSTVEAMSREARNLYRAFGKESQTEKGMCGSSSSIKRKYVPCRLSIVQQLRPLTFDATKAKALLETVTSSVADEKSIVFLDNLNVLMDRFGIVRTAQLMHAASRKCALFAKIHGDTLSAVDWRKLASVATATFELSTYEARTQLCTTTVLKKDGSRSEKVRRWNEMRR